MYHIRFWIHRWRALPTGNRIGSAICTALLICCFIALGCQIGEIAVYVIEETQKRKLEVSHRD